MSIDPTHAMDLRARPSAVQAQAAARAAAVAQPAGAFDQSLALAARSLVAADRRSERPAPIGPARGDRPQPSRRGDAGDRSTPEPRDSARDSGSVGRDSQAMSAARSRRGGDDAREAIHRRGDADPGQTDPRADSIAGRRGGPAEQAGTGIDRSGGTSADADADARSPGGDRASATDPPAGAAESTAVTELPSDVMGRVTVGGVSESSGEGTDESPKPGAGSIPSVQEGPSDQAGADNAMNPSDRPKSNGSDPTMAGRFAGSSATGGSMSVKAGPSPEGSAVKPGTVSSVVSTAATGTTIEGGASLAAASPAARADPGAPGPSGPAAGSPTPPSSGAPDTDANVARIARGLQSALQQHGGSVTLRLTPPELGAVRVQLELADGVVRADLTAEREGVRQLLTHQLHHLRQSLESHGLVVDRLQVQSPGAASEHPSARPDGGTEDGRSRGQFAQQQPSPGERDRGGRGDGDAPRSPRESELFARRLVNAVG